MKILIITLHADPTINPGSEEGGGTHMYVNEIINLLAYKQVESLVVTRKASHGNAFFEFGSVKLKRLSLGPEYYWDKQNLDDREEEIKHLIEKELTGFNFQPDLIHSIYWHSGRAGVFFSKKYNVPLIHTVISLGARKQQSGFDIPTQRIETEKRIFEHASTIISVSEQEKSDMISNYRIEPGKIKVIGRGVDNVFLKDLYDENGTLLPKSSLPVIN